MAISASDDGARPSIEPQRGDLGVVIPTDTQCRRAGGANRLAVTTDQRDTGGSARLRWRLPHRPPRRRSRRCRPGSVAATPIAASPSASAADTVTSGCTVSKRSVNVRCRVSVNTYVPATNATPSTTASADRARRPLCARAVRKVARSTSAAVGGVEVEHGGRAPSPASGRPARRRSGRRRGTARGRRRRRRRVVGDHDDRLAELVDRAAQEAEHLRAGARVEVAGGLVGEDDRRAG